jgi:hypothetical protein
MLNSGFWENVLANLLSDLAVGVVLGSLLTWWIGKRLGLFELSQHQKADICRARYNVALLRREVIDFTGKAPRWIDELRDDKLLIIPSVTYWDMMKHDLPRLLSTGTLARLKNYYVRISLVREGCRVISNGRQPSQPLASMAKDTVIDALDFVIQQGPELAETLDAELDRSQEQLRRLGS